MVDMLVCMCSSMRFSSAVSSRLMRSIGTISRMEIDNSCAKLSYMHSPRTLTFSPTLIWLTLSITA